MANANWKKTGIALLISRKSRFLAESITRNVPYNDKKCSLSGHVLVLDDLELHF